MSKLTLIHNVPGEATFYGSPDVISQLVAMMKGQQEVTVQETVTNCGCKPTPIPRSDWNGLYNNMSALNAAPQQKQSASQATNSQRKQQPIARTDWSSTYNSLSPLGTK